MRHHPAALLPLLAVGIIAIGCAAGESPQAVDRKNPSHAIELPRQTLTFHPTRDDLSVGCVLLSMVGTQPARVNGVENGSRYAYLCLRQVAKNQFELPAMKIEYSLDGPEPIFCMSVKVWFNEVTNQHDSDLYVNRDDRYSLVSWCTSPPELSSDTSYKARFGENRVQTFDEFKARLAEPFVLRMNQREIKPEFGYPMINNQGRAMSESDVKAVEQLVRNQGEQYLIAVSMQDSDHANVTTSIGDATRFQGTRDYKLARSGAGWQIQSVVTHPNQAGQVYW
jgi:hypothetical protein